MVRFNSNLIVAVVGSIIIIILLDFFGDYNNQYCENRNRVVKAFRMQKYYRTHYKYNNFNKEFVPKTTGVSSFIFPELLSSSFTTPQHKQRICRTAVGGTMIVQMQSSNNNNVASSLSTSLGNGTENGYNTFMTDHQQQHQQQLLTNQELVQRRLEKQNGQKVERIQSLQERQQRNLRLKEQLYNTPNNNNHQQQQINLFSTAIVSRNNTLVENSDTILNDVTQNIISSSRCATKENNSNNHNSNHKNNLIAVKVTVCNELRTELKLSGREKRGRVFVEINSDATKTIRGLKKELHGFFRALRKGTYIIEASLVQQQQEQEQQQQDVDDNNKHSTNATESLAIESEPQPAQQIVVNRIEDDENNTSIETSSSWQINTDNDVVVTFERAIEYFNNEKQEQEEERQKRPSIVLYIRRDPAVLLPSELEKIQQPLYMKNLPNPDDSTTITMLSFYSFGTIKLPELFADQLRTLWKPFHALGRVYVATEGINAQMAVPTNVLSQFIQCCEYDLPDSNISYYLRTMGNSVNIDPIPLTREEYNVAGTPAAGGTKPIPPFTNLHIRVRQQIVSDGLDKPYDWYQAGYDMPPLEWHAKLQEIQRLKQQQQQEQQEKTAATTSTTTTMSTNETIPIVLDCRNTYETDVGIFDGAIPLQTTTFKDTWEQIRTQLNGRSKDTPIMMYCTGGIRCVKVGAYVTQELGYTNVSRLAGGIIAYDRVLQQQQQQKNKTNDERNDSNVNAVHKDVQVEKEINNDTNTNDADNDNYWNSLFKGTNFVFDGRLGRPITNDELGKCITCGTNTTYVSNCRNDNCHKRIVQCPNCCTIYLGSCSVACRNRVQKQQSAMVSTNEQETTGIVNRYGLYDDPNNNNRVDDEQQAMNGYNSNVGADDNSENDTDSSNNNKNTNSQTVPDYRQRHPQVFFSTIDSYANGYSSPVPSIYKELEYNTKTLIPTGSHMVSGQAQGRLLKQFASMTREGRILEIGTFTGYATSCLFEGSITVGNMMIDSSGKLTTTTTTGTRVSGPYVLSMERDSKAYEVAVKHLTIVSEYGFTGETAAEAMCALRGQQEQQQKQSFDVKDGYVHTFVDKTKTATCELMKVSDALATIEMMAATTTTSTTTSTTGQTTEEIAVEQDYIAEIAPFDMVFVDADKTRLVEYIEALVSSDRVLKKGGLIVVDNVLWKGLVLEAASGGFSPPNPNQSTATGSSNGNQDGMSDDDNDDDESNDSNSHSENGLLSLAEIRKNRRARKLANKMHRFNSAIVNDPRLEVLVLPVRDGLSIIRKKVV